MFGILAQNISIMRTSTCWYQKREQFCIIIIRPVQNICSIYETTSSKMMKSLYRISKHKHYTSLTLTNFVFAELSPMFCIQARRAKRAELCFARLAWIQNMGNNSAKTKLVKDRLTLYMHMKLWKSNICVSWVKSACRERDWPTKCQW